ncbi:hypothetical protein AYI68_g1201 [Smittium mucronatum]|uniref:Uncharacterized protein n=1 Tax=Smittium mucronatum TaxID=133383 RepID=A0A1R0H668_9FUNG|nr:hypothetical protein AYI68_g1201 [Smittium mucronatum]
MNRKYFGIGIAAKEGSWSHAAAVPGDYRIAGRAAHSRGNDQSHRPRRGSEKCKKSANILSITTISSKFAKT